MASTDANGIPTYSKAETAEGAGQGALAGAGTGAALGGTIGTIVPGVGNVVGAAAGAIIGGLIGAGIGGAKANAAQQTEIKQATDEANAAHDASVASGVARNTQIRAKGGSTPAVDPILLNAAGSGGSTYEAWKAGAY